MKLQLFFTLAVSTAIAGIVSCNNEKEAETMEQIQQAPAPLCW
jgi:hypothetical protein